MLAANESSKLDEEKAKERERKREGERKRKRSNERKGVRAGKKELCAFNSNTWISTCPFTFLTVISKGTCYSGKLRS